MFLYKPDLGFITSWQDTIRSQPLHQGLIAWWPVVEGGGSTLYELSGNGNHSTLTNTNLSTVWIVGPHGAAIDLDGTDDYAAAAVASAPTTAQATLVMRFRVDTVANYRALLMNGPGRMGLLLSGGAGNAVTYLWENTADEYNAVNGLTLTLGTWNFAAVVITPMAATVYLNAASWTNTKTHTAKSLASAEWAIGRDSFVPDAGVRYWNGAVSEAMLFARSLEATEIAALRDQPMRPFDLAWQRTRRRVFAVSATPVLEQTAFRWRNDDGDLTASASLAPEFFGKMVGWADLQLDYGAVGDGVTDDTAALQAALDAVEAGTMCVLWIPAGTYRITSTVYLTGVQYVRIVGEDPATTTLRWEGVGGANKVMIHLNGVSYSSMSRCTWDGQGAANLYCAVYQARVGSTGFFDTGNEYADCHFQDCGVGLSGGEEGGGFAETTIMRCTFSDCTAGVILGNFNALDIWIWYCTFDTCDYGIRAYSGAFRAYQCLFLGSTTADMQMDGANIYSVRDCTSIGSARFVRAFGSSNAACILLQANRVIDPTTETAITVSNAGPLICLDNVLRSASGHTTGPVLEQTGSYSDTITIGNTFCSEVGSHVSAADRHLTFGNVSVSRASIDGTAPEMPGPPAVVSRHIEEVAGGASAATIQSAIDNAVAAGNGAVVHLQAGTSLLSVALTIPANSHIQLVGDGFGRSLLQWNGGATSAALLQAAGPGQLTLQDLQLHGNDQAHGLTLTSIDQAGSRVSAHRTHWQDSVVGLDISGLEACRVELRDIGLKALGDGVLLDPGASPTTGCVLIASGASGNNTMTYRVRSGVLLVRDVWYEQPGSAAATVMVLTGGTVTVESCRWTSGQDGLGMPAVSPDCVAVEALQGSCLVLGLKLGQPGLDTIHATGSGSHATIALLGVYGDQVPWLEDDTSPAATVSLQNSRTLTPNEEVANSGAATSTFLAPLLAPTRAEHPGLLEETPIGSSDVRLWHVSFQRCQTGLELVEV